MLCACFGQVSQEITGATTEKMCERKTRLLTNMFERVLALVSEAMAKQMRINRTIDATKSAAVVTKLTASSNVVSSLLRRAAKTKIAKQEVESLMDMLEEVLQIVAELDKANGRGLRLNKNPK